MDFPALNMSVTPDVKGFFDLASNTISYIVHDPDSEACAIIDSVLDLDYAAGRITYGNAERLIDAINAQGLSLEWIIETHVHADHLSAAPYIQQKLGGKIGVGARIREVQNTFGKIFNEGTEFQRDGSQFDVLFENGDIYMIGNMKAFTIAAPGHTPACMTHVIGNAAFVGDTLLMPDTGSGRADFPGGDAGQLFDSIQNVLTLPGEMRLFIGHDYAPGGRAVAWETTVAKQLADNIQVGGGRSREDFVKIRKERDSMLTMPRLIIPSLQANMRAGEIPRDDSGTPMFKVPVNRL